ncbi:isochorismatase family protein [Candidatus Woesearchaeota archaeon]|nr:isochorismatase family protein [Candidatus Woesearchaeota archaeon]
MIIDIQEKFRKAIPNLNEVITNTNKLIKAFQLLKIPIILTEQYPKGLGSTVKEISIKPTIIKEDFDCFNHNDFSNN